MGFLSFLLGRDLMGHSIRVTYKGSSSYNTAIGSAITIFIQIFVAVYLVIKSLDLVNMKNPSI